MTIEEFKLALVRTLFNRVSIDVTSHISISDKKYKSLLLNSYVKYNNFAEDNIIAHALTLNQISTLRMFFELRLVRVEYGGVYYFFDSNDHVLNKLDDDNKQYKVDKIDLVLKPLMNLNDIDDAIIALYNAYSGIVKAGAWNNKAVFKLAGLRELLSKMSTNNERLSYLNQVANDFSKTNDSEILVLDKDDTIAINNFDFDSIGQSVNYAMQKICMATGISKNILTGESVNSLNGAGILAQERLGYETVVQALVRQLDIDLLSYYIKDSNGKPGYMVGSSLIQMQSIIDLANDCTDPIAKNKLYGIINSQIDAMIV
jgi:hypothetical protein